MYLGVDIGSTSLKAAVFDDASGRLLAQGEQRLALTTDDTGRREQDPAALLRALDGVVAQLRGAVRGRWRRVRGIGVAAQGGSTLLVDRRTGRPATPLILWNDARALRHFHALAAELPASWWRAFSQRDEPAMGLARLRWLREQSPRLFDSRPLCVGVGEHVFFALTGEWRQDACHALQSGCYDARHDRLTTRALARVGLPEDLFPPLRERHTTRPLTRAAAARLHLPPGLPVAGPYNDHEAAFASLAQGRGHPLAVSLGTAWVGNFVLPASFHGRSPFQLLIPAPNGTGHQVIQPLMTGNVTLDWARAAFRQPSPAAARARTGSALASPLLPPPGLTALPWLNRPNPLCPPALGAGGFFGITPATTPTDQYRALVAAMCFELQRVLGPVVARGAADVVILSGGSAHDPQLAALIGALFAPVPVHRAVDPSLMGARGSLVAFAPGITASALAPLPPATGLDRSALHAARALYLEVFSRLCGQVPAGRPYALSRRRAALPS
jgi:sugar (pentulose or hexulose) kinase